MKKIRVLTASIIFTLFLLVFLGGDNFATGSIAEILLYFQFIPSLVKFVLSPGGVISLGFLVIVLLTVVFGRVYCSFLCPLGILQDMNIYLSGKVNPKKKTPFNAHGTLHGILY